MELLPPIWKHLICIIEAHVDIAVNVFDFLTKTSAECLVGCLSIGSTTEGNVVVGTSLMGLFEVSI